ncbi:regulator of chromosome condensation 1/beta-lactamase-inhibitor protein II [Blastocladiella britannica]|nr:regulator of chromosome condensation 1/beta-lactamase-inhibitor protein II [Blastocladiella britannica]
MNRTWSTSALGSSTLGSSPRAHAAALTASCWPASIPADSWVHVSLKPLSFQLLLTKRTTGILPDSNDHPAGAWSRHVWSLPDKSVVHCIALGRQHSLALIQDGTGSRTVWTAGSNHFGQSLLSAPSLINAWSAPDLPLGDVVHVAAGYDHSVFLHASGTVSSAGWASDGQTGHAATGVYGSWARLQQLGGNEGPGSAVRRIVAGADHTLAITADQRPGDGVRGCYAWGNSEYGQCATGRAVDRIAAPVPATVPWTRAHPERAHPTSADAYAFPGSSDVALVDAAAGASASLFAVACTPPFSSATWWARRSPVTAGTAALAPPPRGPSPAGIDRRLVYAGHGVSEGAAVPLPASVPADGEWALVSARGHAVGLHTTRRVFTANGASLAACAHGSGVASDPWRRVFHVLDAGERITAVALGVDFGLAVTELS